VLPKTAFVLDDEPQVGAVVCKVLGSMGLAARAFCAPAHFFAELEGSQPDLVVLDLALKGSDAIEVIRRLEELRFTGSVMLISGRDQGTLEEVERIGAAHGLAMLPSLQKPFRAADLRKKLACEPLGGAPAEPRAAEGVPANGRVVHLEEALERRWLEVWYQAKIDLKSMTICGAEALVRARHPKHGVVAPAEFLPPAGDPLYHPLSSFVLRCAMADWAIFADHGAALRLSVNSPVSVLHAPDFISLIRRSLPDDGRFPGLILEVTEDEIIRDAGWMHEVAAQLRLYNVSLSIDDFGSAYASLARLRDLPFVEIKLDRGFVASCADNPLNRGVCATVIDLAHRFQASLCAEGVETEENLHCLMAMGCDTAQGYLFAKPMPRDTFVQLLGAQPLSFERLHVAASKRAAKG
jgi:EAL domain-containing protein (putative c-di-GMP-specific phosphodiesterase class I)/CheY-like chemotaxis protein